MTAVVDEREALMNLFASLKGEDWHNNRGWGTKKELKEWFGLKINDEGKVVSIQLDQNNLRGSLSSSLAALKELKVLSMHSNRISGDLPNEITHLQKLENLDLHHNVISGCIPEAIGNLTSLLQIDLHDNMIGGNLMSCFCILSANGCCLGQIPLSFGDLSLLTHCSLSNNQLQGEIPSSLGNLKNLTQLFLYENFLSGRVPPTLGHYQGMHFLFLGDNMRVRASNWYRRYWDNRVNFDDRTLEERLKLISEGRVKYPRLEKK